MMIAMACLIGAVVFLAALPVRLGALKLPERPLRLGVTLGPVRIQTDVCFSFQEDAPVITLRFRRHSRALPLTRESLRLKNPPPVKNALRALVRHMRCDRLDLDADIALNHAALTAPAAALLAAALDALGRIFEDIPLKCRVGCAFSGSASLRALGIVSLRAGHIMIAALILGRDIIARRLHQWRSIPSRPS